MRHLDFQGGDLIDQAKLGSHTIYLVAAAPGLTLLLLRARQAFVPFSKSGYKRQNAPLFTGVRELLFSEIGFLASANEVQCPENRRDGSKEFRAQCLRCFYAMPR